MCRDGADDEEMCRDGAEGTIGRSLSKSIVLGPETGELCLRRAESVCRDGADRAMCRDGAGDKTNNEMCRDGAKEEAKEFAEMAQTTNTEETTRVPRWRRTNNCPELP
eukprot:s3520_g1.t1